jgi:uncharacterized membrane protein
MGEILLSHVRSAFERERVICRVIAAWLGFSALALLGADAESFSEIAFGQDVSLTKIALGTAIAFLLFSLVAVAAGEWVNTDSWFLLLCGGICSVRWLLLYDHSTNEFLFALCMTAVLALILVYFFRANERLFSYWKPGRGTIVAVAVAVGLLTGAVIATITCLRYKTFSSPNFDFGLFVNMFHNMKETGIPLVTSERDGLLSHFAVHISPIFYVLLPFYWLFPSPLTLQIGQAVVLALGIVPVVLLCRHFKLSGKVTVFMACLYAFYPVMSSGTFYDIHENCFLTLTLLLTFLFYEKQKIIPMYLSAVSVLMVKEDAAIYLLVFALFVLLSERRYLHGAILAAMSVGYFLLAVHMLEKYGTGTLNDRFNNVIFDKDEGLISAAKTALRNPGYILTQLFTTSKGGWEKILYFLQMLLPLGFLPFCSKKASRWLLITPILVNMVSYYVYLYDPGFQYHFASVAFLFYATVKNLPELSAPTKRNLLSLAAAGCCCLYLVTVCPKYSTYTERWENGKATYNRMEEILDTVPEDASVVCSSFLLAHLADRDEIYELTYHKNKPDVDFVVLDSRYSSSQEYLWAYIQQGYTVYSHEPNLITILQKGEEPPEASKDSEDSE